jgi:hypothetical protein
MTTPRRADLAREAVARKRAFRVLVRRFGLVVGQSEVPGVVEASLPHDEDSAERVRAAWWTSGGASGGQVSRIVYGTNESTARSWTDLTIEGLEARLSLVLGRSPAPVVPPSPLAQE